MSPRGARAPRPPVLAAALAVGFLFLPLFVLLDPFGMYAELVR